MGYARPPSMSLYETPCPGMQHPTDSLSELILPTHDDANFVTINPPTLPEHLIQWGAQRHLTVDTIQAIYSIGFRTLPEILAMQSEDLDELSKTVARGQLRLLQQNLGGGSGISSPVLDWVMPISSPADRNVPVSNLLNLGDSASNVGGISTTTSSANCYLSTSRPQKKPMLIQHFLDSLPSFDSDDSSGNSSGGGGQASCGSTLLAVTPPQWIAANARIMDMKIEKGEITTLDEVRQYLLYTAKLGELAERFEWPAILRYDYEYRSHQAALGFPWGQDDNHLIARLLTSAAVMQRQTPTSNI